MMVRDFQAVIGRETRRQCQAAFGAKPDVLLACVGGGSNAIGLFHEARARLLGPPVCAVLWQELGALVALQDPHGDKCDAHVAVCTHACMPSMCKVPRAPIRVVPAPPKLLCPGSLSTGRFSQLGGGTIGVCLPGTGCPATREAENKQLFVSNDLCYTLKGA